MNTEIMEALEQGFEKYLGKLAKPKLWSPDDVCHYLDIGRSIFESKVKKAEAFPLPRMIGNSPKYKPSEVMDWADKQKVLRVGRKRA